MGWMPWHKVYKPPPGFESVIGLIPGAGSIFDTFEAGFGAAGGLFGPSASGGSSLGAFSSGPDGSGFRQAGFGGQPMYGNQAGLLDPITGFLSSLAAMIGGMFTGMGPVGAVFASVLGALIGLLPFLFPFTLLGVVFPALSPANWFRTKSRRRSRRRGRRGNNSGRRVTVVMKRGR